MFTTIALTIVCCVYLQIRTQDWNSTMSLPGFEPINYFKNITEEHSLPVSEVGMSWALCLRLSRSGNPGRSLLTDTLSLSAPGHKKSCLGFQNMLFVQPQRGPASCRATDYRVDRPVAGHLRGREETWRHGRVAARQKPRNSFCRPSGRTE